MIEHKSHSLVQGLDFYKTQLLTTECLVIGEQWQSSRSPFISLGIHYMNIQLPAYVWWWVCLLTINLVPILY
jgi:hypothetical protein